MTCDELRQLLPDLADGTLDEPTRQEAEATLLNCPDCQQELDVVRQIQTLMAELRLEYGQLNVPAGFELRLLDRVRQQSAGLDLFDLSSRAFAVWLVELINLIGGLLSPLNPAPRPS